MATILNHSALEGPELDHLSDMIERHQGLRDVLAWTGHTIAEVVTQDEFTHDVIVAHQNVFLVYDTT